jgi:putative phosphoribosyl transferase
LQIAPSTIKGVFSIMMKYELFENRQEAGKQLADKLEKFGGQDTIVLGIPRGGVVVGYEIAKQIGAPLDIVVPRKLRAPNQPELAIGAITEDGNVFLDDQIVNSLNVSDDYLKMESQRQKKEIDRRLRAYKGEEKVPDLNGLNVIVVDDGVATGATMNAALVSVRKRGAKSVILAVPVASERAFRLLEKEADETICLSTPTPFFAIGQFYRNFEQTSDEEVKELLKKNRMELR